MANVIPESCAPQLGGPKKSPSVQLGAVVIVAALTPPPPLLQAALLVLSE
jgi:hypothetical protein